MNILVNMELFAIGKAIKNLWGERWKSKIAHHILSKSRISRVLYT